MTEMFEQSNAQATEIEQSAEVVRLIRPIQFLMPFDDEAYRKSLRDRAHQLAPYLWLATNPPPHELWNDAIQDPRLAADMARCLATAELCVRIVDVICSRQS